MNAVYVVTGIDFDNGTCVFGIYEKKERAEFEVKRIKNAWQTGPDAGSAMAERHANAVRMIELKAGFKEYEIFD